jgi:hypothetical protein
VSISFEADMKHWSVFVSEAKEDRGAHVSDATIMIGAHVSDATIMIGILALVAALGWFVFGDAVSHVLSRI